MAKRPPIALLRDNPFKSMAQLFMSSVGRMPTPLMVILAVSLVAAVLCGVFLKFYGPADTANTYLPERLSPQNTAAPVSEAALTGVWVNQNAQGVATLRIGNGMFELIVFPKGGRYIRNFVRGGYRIDGNVLILQQRKDLGTPVDPQHLEIAFLPIAFASLNTFVAIGTGNRQMSWQLPKAEAARLPDMFPPLSTNGTVGWQRLRNRP